MNNHLIKRITDFAKEFWAEWNDDKVDQLASSLAYYTIFSLSPLLIIGMAIVSFFFDRDQAQGQLLAQMENLIGRNSAELIQSMLVNASQGNGGLIASIISFATLLWGAASIFGHIQNALNAIWDVEPPKHTPIWDFVRSRALSFLLVLGGGVLGLLSLVLTSIFASLGNFMAQAGFNVALWDAVTNFGLVFVFVAIALALIYKVLPDIVIPWRDAWLGAGVASLMFVLGKSVLGWYFANNSAISVYGAAGSLVALLLWIYYSSQIFFFGAEFAQVYSLRRARKKGIVSPTTAAAEQGATASQPMPISTNNS